MAIHCPDLPTDHYLRMYIIDGYFPERHDAKPVEGDWSDDEWEDFKEDAHHARHNPPPTNWGYDA